MATSISSAVASTVGNTLLRPVEPKSRSEVAANPATTNTSTTAPLPQVIEDSAETRVAAPNESAAAATRLSEELNAQFNQSRLQGNAGAPPPPTDAVASEEAATSAQVSQGAPQGAAPAPRGAGGGAAPAAQDDGNADAIKYSTAADTDNDGTVSEDEEAAFKKAVANAEAKAREQLKAYAQETTGTESTFEITA